MGHKACLINYCVSLYLLDHNSAGLLQYQKNTFNKNDVHVAALSFDISFQLSKKLNRIR